MSIADTLAEAMHLPADSDTVQWLHDNGVAVADHMTMSQAIHEVYCGATSDHHEPNEKDREQALALMVIMREQATRP
jgi:hypothetical protein